MIKSMTGYGKSNLSKDLREYQIEMKSVNNRYLDISVKMPRFLNYLEEDIKKEISSKIKRGKVDVYITFKNDSTEGKQIKINTEIAKVYISELKKMAEQENILSNIEVTEISKYPDVLNIENVQQDDEVIRNELLPIIEIATQSLVQMRTVEGEKILKDFLFRIENIKEKINEISSLSTGLIEQYVVKLEKRIEEILKNQEIDKSRLAQEVVIYADKCSIEEEVTRLNSHIVQFEKLVNNTQGPIGKKLDFLIQEMNRETNTIGSKANNLDITNGVIDIKTQLENIREQVQNIE